MKKIEIEVWKIFAILAIVFGMVAIPLTVMAIHYGVNYERNCSAHIWNASRSSTPELAAEELTKAIDYMQANKMTFGTSTSGASKNNVGWFYESLVSARDNLENFHETSSEESYYLELSKATDKIKDMADAQPFCISLYQHPIVSYFWLALIVFIAFIIIALIKGEEYHPSTCEIYVPKLFERPIPVEDAKI